MPYKVTLDSAWAEVLTMPSAQAATAEAIRASFIDVLSPVFFIFLWFSDLMPQ
jgi:hypothetical protein